MTGRVHTMINIDTATILDILPHTFLTDECRAVAAAIQRMNAKYSTVFTGLLLWGDLANAPDNTLDALAAEVDAPFYETELTPERKREIIYAAFARNSRIGTVQSITELLTAAFGDGKLEEWYDYGGEPYHFRIDIITEYPKSITQKGFELLINNISKLKPIRAKLDGTTFTRTTRSEPVYISIGLMKRHKKRIIPAATPQDEERGYN